MTCKKLENGDLLISAISVDEQRFIDAVVAAIEAYKATFEPTPPDSVATEIQEKGLAAPRITAEDIEANIIGEFYFTAADGVNGAFGSNLPHAGTTLGSLTFCVLILRNGFTVTGESACVSPENFDAEIGRKIAREKALDKVWSLMGYELKSKLCGTTSTVHSSAAEDFESTLTPKRPGFPEAKLPGHGYGLRHIGQPHSAFHETEDERKNRLSDQRIAQSIARLMPKS
jgi:hypothetical protein